MADPTAWRLPTSWLAALCIALVAALYIDEWWQSGGRQQLAAIHPLQHSAKIELYNGHQLEMSFERNDDRWQLITPIRAPANPQVIEHLLASNHHISRSYELIEIESIAREPALARLGIDGRWFEFKSIEPVSGLRYVVSADRIYLQPDRVVPLLQSGLQIVVDRRLANVCSAKNSECDPVSIEAAELIAHEPGELPIGDIDVLLANGKIESYALYTRGQQIALHRRGTHYRYLLANSTAELLGLSLSPI